MTEGRSRAPEPSGPGDRGLAPHLRGRAAATYPAAGAPRVNAAHRVVLADGGTPIFGPGTYDLLVLVDETGSLRQAAHAMGMSYSKAWRVVREAEEHLGLELLRRRAGGPGGGGSSLSDDGRQVVLRFRALVAEADAELETLYREHFGDAPFARPAVPPPGAPPALP